MITLTGRFDRVLRTDRNAIVSFTIPNYQAGYLKDIGIEDYVIEIKKPKSRKSLQQNNFAWQLMTEIARELSYYPSPESVYEQLLQLAKIKIEHLAIPNTLDAINRMKRIYRIVKVRDEWDKGKIAMVTVECYIGMSDFNKDEMTRFIEVLLDYAVQNGIDVSGYER